MLFKILIWILIIALILFLTLFIAMKVGQFENMRALIDYIIVETKTAIG